MPWRHGGYQASAEAGVLFQGIVYGGTGYAEECWVIALGLAEEGIPVQLVPIGGQEDSKGLLPRLARQNLECLTRQRVDPGRSVLYQHAMAYLWNLDAHGRYRVGRTMFETDRIPDGWAERCNALDEVWVPTHFNRETFAAAGVEADKLRVMPPGVDTELFRPGALALQIPQARRFNFLSVFDFQDRKGMDILLRAYVNEFKADEDVALILKVSRHTDPLADPEAQLAYFVEREVGRKLEHAPPIILLQGFIPQIDVAGLYAAADAFVLSSRGEGYGRPYLEALSCGLPVIATRWSGQLDFLNNENSYLIDIEGLAPASVGEETFAGHLWAEPSVEHLRQLMREVYSHPTGTRMRAERGRAEMVERWDWSVIVPRWVNEFRRLLD